MSEAIGNVYVNIVPKAQGISGQISGLLGGPSDAAGSAAGEKMGSGLLSGMKKIFAGAAVGKILKDAFEAGGNLEQSFGGLDTIYGDAADQAKSYAKAAASAGISANDYAEQAVSMGAALKQAFGGDTAAAAESANMAIMDMADNAAKMGTDIGSLQTAYQGFAKQNYTMLDNLKLGYGGTKTEMERLLADATAITGIKYDINNLGDVYSAIHVIQGELNLTGVAAQEASTTLSGSFNAVKASWTNVLAALMTGNGLDEAIANLVTSFGAFADNVIRMLENLAPQMPELIIGLVTAIIEMAPDFLAAAIKLITELGVGLVQAMPDIIAMIPDLFQGVIDAVLEVDWLSLGLDIVNGIIEGLWSGAQALWDTLANLAASALQAAKDFLGIESPSKVFASEVGRWLPEGIAVGVDENLSAVDSAVAGMARTMTSDMARSLAGGSVSGTDTGRIDYDALAAAIASRPIVIEGDTNKIFRVVQKQNQVQTRATSYNILAGTRA